MVATFWCFRGVSVATDTVRFVSGGDDHRVAMVGEPFQGELERGRELLLLHWPRYFFLGRGEVPSNTTIIRFRRGEASSQGPGRPLYCMTRRWSSLDPYSLMTS
jgi:hypothetical protein